MNGKSSQYFLQGESAVTESTLRKKVGERTPWSWQVESLHTSRPVRIFLR